jgi:hypothetical protein
MEREGREEDGEKEAESARRERERETQLVDHPGLPTCEIGLGEGRGAPRALISLY